MQKDSIITALKLKVKDPLLLKLTDTSIFLQSQFVHDHTKAKLLLFLSEAEKPNGC